MQQQPEDIPPAERTQPDPQLELSHGRASGLQIGLIALACLAVVALTMYGLGRPATTDGDISASAPSAQTTGSAPPAEAPAPQNGGNVAGGENVAPKPPASDAASPQQPATEPVPQQVKPGVVPDDSTR
jgi:hypothetical protein